MWTGDNPLILAFSEERRRCMCSDKSSVYILDGKELNADELIMELAEHGKIFLNFDRDISKFGTEVTL
ncbi:hypothetical protein [Enterocloster citroniae]